MLQNPYFKMSLTSLVKLSHTSCVKLSHSPMSRR
jgi:hypothetical protein